MSGLNKEDGRYPERLPGEPDDVMDELRAMENDGINGDEDHPIKEDDPAGTGSPEKIPAGFMGGTF